VVKIAASLSFKIDQKIEIAPLSIESQSGCGAEQLQAANMEAAAQCNEGVTMFVNQGIGHFVFRRGSLPGKFQ
ncbi:MAG: hypothetical protein KC587_14585, partial [Nitrospira sp.]|nr:hypothetical protein [Nitrospira sp.]